MKQKFEFTCFTIQEAGKDLYQACRVDRDTGRVEALPKPYGDPMEKRQAIKEAMSAMHRELVMGMKTSPEMLTLRGLSPDFKISGR